MTLHQLAKLPPEQRPGFIRKIGGTNIPKRKYWLRMLERGRRHGFYQIRVGEVAEVVPGPGGDKTLTRVKERDGIFEVVADYIIDATGLEADIEEHRIYEDLLTHSGARKNTSGRLDIVQNTFEITGTASPPGKMYATGTVCLGSHFAPNDSFLGLQYGALQIVDDLTRDGFCRRIGVARSVSEWIKWARNKTI